MSSQRFDTFAGEFGLCAGIWDEKQNKYIPATDTEIGLCSLDVCVPFVKECRSVCKTFRNNDPKCVKICDEIATVCEYDTELSGDGIWDTRNPIYKATKDVGCGDGFYTDIDRDCMRDNKDEIISTCMHGCMPTSTLDCSQHCNFSYDALLNNRSNVLRENYENNKDFITLRKRIDYMKYMYILIGIICIIIFIEIIRRICIK
jgi:hypothetical protein